MIQIAKREEKRQAAAGPKLLGAAKNRPPSGARRVQPLQHARSLPARDRPPAVRRDDPPLKKAHTVAEAAALRRPKSRADGLAKEAKFQAQAAMEGMGDYFGVSDGPKMKFPARKPEAEPLQTLPRKRKSSPSPVPEDEPATGWATGAEWEPAAGSEPPEDQDDGGVSPMGEDAAADDLWLEADGRSFSLSPDRLSGLP